MGLQLDYSDLCHCSYIFCIGPDDYNNILYTDKLVTVSDVGKELGDFTVTVERARRDGERCFLIHAHSHGSIDNVPCGTSITTYVTTQLETLEQQHHEYVKVCIRNIVHHVPS